MNHALQKTHDNEFAAYAGIDWADQEHAVCLAEHGNEQLEFGQLPQRPEAIDAWVCQLRQRFPGKKIAVCLEQTKGALIYALMKYDLLVLYPINPKQLSSFRDALGPSGAKDDPSDAALLLRFLKVHRDRLRAWRPDDPQTRLIAMLSEDRRGLVDLRTELSNRLKSRIKQYFPQLLELVGDDLTTRLACDFLLRFPTLEALQQTDPEEIRRFYYGHNSRRPEMIAQRLAIIRDAKPLTTDEAIVQSAVMQVRTLGRQLRDLIDPIAEYDKKLASLMKDHPDGEYFETLPGAGAALAPRLLTAFGTDRTRLEDATEMQCISGIAPVTKRSGKAQWIHRRWACSKFVRQTFHEFATHSRRKSAWAEAYYRLQRSRGKPHHTAIRALAFKWIRILFHCWKTRTHYHEATYLASLKQRNSPIVEYLPSPTH
jgi:transposase